MEINSKKILFFAEAVTLAHIARCVVMADKLYATGKYTIALAADKRYDELFGKIPYQRISLRTVSSTFFFNRLSKGAPIYSADTLTEYVNGDLKIIEAYKPDFIIGDFRLSLAISSRLKKIPYATITNAYWSPYADINFPIPEIPLTKILGVSIAQKLFDIAKPFVFKLHSLALNKTLTSFGLSPLEYDMRESYTHADYTLYADIESLIPMKPYPKNHCFIGPVLWSAIVDFPKWWTTLPVERPIIFVSLGSSGDNRLLPMIIEALSTLKVTVMCVTVRHKVMLKQSYENVYVTDFLPAEEAVKKSDIVICNGGSPMVYQSLVQHKKVIGIPGNLDQYLMMSILKNSGQGEMIRAGKANISAVQNAVSRSLSLIQEQPEPQTPIDFNSIYKIEKLIDSGICVK